MARQKLHEYEGCLGRFHRLRDDVRDRFDRWKEEKIHADTRADNDFSHIYRSKTRSELVRLSAAVMGIEFSYAAETAFVSPTLLKIGVEHKHMTLVWALSPLIGFFLTPVLGSFSDRCRLQMGRRRPFIFIMSLGVLLGLILVPNGELLGYYFGDVPNFNESFDLAAHRTTIFTKNTTESEAAPENHEDKYWGILFTILGTVLLDFDADACQSPARAYLLDVTTPDDHARGLSTFTVMAGLGGFLGYALGGINWDATFVGTMLGGHVRAVFTLTTVIFIVCVSYTLTSFREIPLDLLENNAGLDKNYGTLEMDDLGAGDENDVATPQTSLVTYLKSIVKMPFSIRMVCLTNLFCWMAHVCYSLYFTDFVGEAVFGGNPTGNPESPERELYESGVRFGCWGMSMYSLSCACYSMVIEKFIKKYGARFVYVGGLLIYSTGMCLMALFKNKFGVILFSWTAGVMYSTLFTMPYLLVAHYHAKNTFAEEAAISGCQQVRGLGTDVAIVSSMVFLAQFILSICMGWIVNVTGTTTAVIVVACLLALFGSIAATRIVYLDL